MDNYSENNNNSETQKDPVPVTDSSIPEGQGKAKKKSKFGLTCVGCGLVGCVGSVVAVVILMIVSVLWLKNNLYSEAPLDFPDTYLSAQDASATAEKIRAFSAQLDNNLDKSASIALSPEEINYFFDKMSKNRFRAYISIDTNDEMTLLASVPMEGVDNLYMNVSATGDLSVKNGEFKSDFTKMTISKIEIPGGDFLTGFSDGFGQEISSSPVYLSQPYRIENLEIKDKMVTLEMKKVSELPAIDGLESIDEDNDFDA